MRRRRALAVAACCAALGGIAGCGSDDGEPAAGEAVTIGDGELTTATGATSVAIPVKRAAAPPGAELLVPDSDYGMYSAGGAKAVRDALERFAAALRDGANRDAALKVLREAMSDVADRYEETLDTEVCEQVGDAADKLLAGRGLRGTEACDEFLPYREESEGLLGP